MTAPQGLGPHPSAIRARAKTAGVVLSAAGAEALAAHASAVLAQNDRLHLTAITQPEAFFERHLGEAFEGAALLPRDVRGILLDLGSGNGYPGIPLAVCRPGLVPVLAEASAKKAAFLREALAVAGLEEGQVLESRIARTVDLASLPEVAVLTTRAMGGWERIVPKLVTRMASNGVVLLWAGAGAESVMARRAWARLHVEERRNLPGRDQSTVYRLAIIN